MTTTPQVPLSSYVGDGSTTTFATGFTFATAAELVVTVAGVAKTVGVDFDISGVPGGWIVSGANVVFRSGAIPATTAVVKLSRATPRDQPETFGDDEAFSPAQMETALDRLVRIIQEVALIAGSGSAGPAGPPGAAVEMRVSGGQVQYRHTGDVSWTNLIAVADLAGAAVEMRVSGGQVQWRNVGAVSWTNLISVASLTGPAGADGADGATGATGPAGTNGLRAAAYCTISGTTVTLVSQHNVASVTRSGAGLYRVTFTSALPSVNYGVMGGGKLAGASGSDTAQVGADRDTGGPHNAKTTSIVDVCALNAAGTLADPAEFWIAILDPTAL